MVAINGVIFVENHRPFNFNCNNNKIYAVLLFSKEWFQPRVFVIIFSNHNRGQYFGNKENNQRQLSKNSLKRNDKKQQIPRPKDCNKKVIPAPDSASAALEKEDVCDDIPVKDIKLEYKEGSDKVIQDKKWISGLNVSHKKNIIDPKGWFCSDIMNYSLDIKKQFEHIVWDTVNKSCSYI